MNDYCFSFKTHSEKLLNSVQLSKNQSCFDFRISKGDKKGVSDFGLFRVPESTKISKDKKQKEGRAEAVEPF